MPVYIVLPVALAAVFIGIQIFGKSVDVDIEEELTQSNRSIK